MSVNIIREGFDDEEENDMTPGTPVPREDAKKQNESEYNLGDDDIAEDEEDSMEEYTDEKED